MANKSDLIARFPKWEQKFGPSDGVFVTEFLGCRRSAFYNGHLAVTWEVSNGEVCIVHLDEINFGRIAAALPKRVRQAATKALREHKERK